MGKGPNGGSLRRGRRVVRLTGGVVASLGVVAGLGFALEPRADTAARMAEPVAPAAEAPSAAEFAPAIGAGLNMFVELPANFLPALEMPVPTAPVQQTTGPEPAAPVQPTVAAPAPATPVQAAVPAQPVAPAPALEQPAPAPAAPVAPARPNFYLPEPANGAVTGLENRLLAGLNAERTAAGMAPYTYDAGLSRIARVRVKQLVDQGYFDHVDPFGYSMYTELLAHFGYTSYAWAGENLALNNYGTAESPERAVIALMKSPTHRANILATEFSRVGIGEFTTADGRHFYAMIFLG